MVLGQCESIYTQVIPLADIHLRPGDRFLFDSSALIYGNDAAGGISHPPELCVPGRADREWEQMGLGVISIDPNSPYQRLKIELKPFSSNKYQA